MSRKIRKAICAAIPLVFLSAVGCSSRYSHTATVSVREFKSPAPQGAISPRITAMRDGSVLLTWLEPVNEKLATLRASFWRDGTWSPSATVVEERPFSRHASESPGIVALSKANLIAYWSQKPASEKIPTEEVDVYFSVSTDGGLHWSVPAVANTPGTGQESSYPSVAPTDPMHAALIWLDGSDWGKHRRVSLMSRTVNSDGSAGESTVIASDTCTCCPTSLVQTNTGLVAAYRDHTAENIRDIAVIQNAQGHWSEPRIPNADNWHFRGCPVNGPHLDADGSTIALVWFSAPQEPEVQLTYSRDGGTHFTSPIRVDEGNAVGRAQVVLCPEHFAFAFWLENKASAIRLLGRRIADGKTLGTPFEVARGMGLGYPHAVRAGKNTLITWAEESPVSQIHVAIVDESQRDHF